MICFELTTETPLFKDRMAKLPKYFYFRVKSINKGTGILLEDASDADVVEVVRCRECKFWKDIHVLQNDGRERQYAKEEYDGDDFVFISPSVSSSVGINVGSKCMYDDLRGCIVDKTVFRDADDYCSKGEKRPCSYEKWWGIEDGYYPSHE